MTYVDPDSILTDLVGRTLSVGDKVAYPTMSGNSSRMCVAELIEIRDENVTRTRYRRLEGGGYDTYDEEVIRRKVKLQPLHWNDYRSTGAVVDGKWQSNVKRPKAVFVENLDNLVKVELDGVEGN